MKKKIVFITGTRADYGKIKSILTILNKVNLFEIHIYVTGMHMLDYYGNTYKEILRDGFPNVYLSKGIKINSQTEKNLSIIINDFSKYVKRIKPDLIVIHGDRIEPLAGAIVGAFNNIRIAHIEGGEISGTIDEHIRHAISKFSHYHFVSNEESKRRLIQMGENRKNIYVIGSPDIDIMQSKNLPKLSEVKKRYEINFKKYSILIYHPVTTEISEIEKNTKTLLKTLDDSDKNYVVIYPNNDYGSDIIMKEYSKYKNSKFRFLPSMRFEMFLTLLKNSEFIIGNSSAGIKESCVYGIPTINIGTRQNDRYNEKVQKNIVTIEYNYDLILETIKNIKNKKYKSYPFGKGNSCKLFLDCILDEKFWNLKIQKKFIDVE